MKIVLYPLLRVKQSHKVSFIQSVALLVVPLSSVSHIPFDSSSDIISDGHLVDHIRTGSYAGWFTPLHSVHQRGGCWQHSQVLWRGRGGWGEEGVWWSTELAVAGIPVIQPMPVD